MFVRNNQTKGRRAFRDVTNATRGKENIPIGKENIPIGKVNKRAANGTLSTQLPAPSRSRRIETRQPNAPVRPDPRSYQHLGQVDNIDKRDSDNPLNATEYVVGIYKHYRETESATSVRPIYMEKQPQINKKMRSILIDWLVEVHLKFKLVPETLYLTVNLIDRYLEQRVVHRRKLQLIGVSCLLIASKYEEIYPPELRDISYICDGAYTVEEILGMEEVILKSLQYRITIPSAHAFLIRYLKAGHADKKMIQISCYILEGTLQSYNLLQFLPSQLAAASVLIARHTVGRKSWSPTLLKYAAYCEEEIIPVARAILAEKSASAPELCAVNKKYSSSKYNDVASTEFQSRV